MRTTIHPYRQRQQEAVIPNPGLTTEQEAETRQAFADANGNVTAAARDLGIHRATMQGRCRALGLKANPMLVTNRSTLTDADGNVKLIWEKTSLDREAEQEAREAAILALGEQIPRLAPIAPPAATLAALCNLYVITDAHVGMLAWHKEGGADWDLTIAEQTLVGCFEQMIASSPPAKTGIVCQLGDFLHYDSIKPVTPEHKHLLDADGRWRKLIPIAVRIMRRIIDCALHRHEHVHVIMAEGNHDESSSGILQHMFALLYEDDPRVTVDESALPFYVYQHGDTMLGFHHGHKVRNGTLPGYFAEHHSRMWGATTKRYAHCGHRHHVDEKEGGGMIVTQHSTLAARDAYAARGGWGSERQATGTTYHERNGRVATITVTPEMLEAS